MNSNDTRTTPHGDSDKPEPRKQKRRIRFVRLAIDLLRLASWLFTDGPRGDE